MVLKHARVFVKAAKEHKATIVQCCHTFEPTADSISDLRILLIFPSSFIVLFLVAD